MSDAPPSGALSSALALVYLLAAVLSVLWLPHSQGHEGMTVVITAALVIVAVQVAFHRLRARAAARADRHQDEGNKPS